MLFTLYIPVRLIKKFQYCQFKTKIKISKHDATKLTSWLMSPLSTILAQTFGAEVDLSRWPSWGAGVRLWWPPLDEDWLCLLDGALWWSIYLYQRQGTIPYNIFQYKKKEASKDNTSIKLCFFMKCRADNVQKNWKNSLKENLLIHEMS